MQDIVNSDCIEMSYTLKIVWRDTISSVIHEIGVVSSIFRDASLTKRTIMVILDIRSFVLLYYTILSV